MKRREFITLLGGAAAWPMVARAQQGMRRIGVLLGNSEADAEAQGDLKDFRDALRSLGSIEGRNVTFIHRWAAGNNDLIKIFAKELVALAPNLILTASVQLVSALRDETRTIPILIGAGSDPVEMGLVESLARPGGNITGFMSIAAATNVKSLELIKELDPRIARVMVLMTSKDPSNPGRLRAIEGGGPVLKVEVTSVDIATAVDIERAVAAFAAGPAGALIVLPSPVTNLHSATVVEVAARHRLPAIYQFRYLVTAGGLLAYGPDRHDQFRRAASYADRILKGEKPGDLPIQAPAKFELIINLKTAKALGLDIPPMLLARADEVVE